MLLAQNIGPLLYLEKRFHVISLKIALLCAITLHIIGISFFSDKISWQRPKTTPPMLEVTLATEPENLAPNEADFLADRNQLGGGDRDEANIPNQDPTPHELTTTTADTPLEPEQVITTNAPQAPFTNDIAELEQDNEANLEEQIANLSAIVERQREAWAKRPRRRHISAATFEARDAAYLHAWQQHIEEIGNLNYPVEAKQANITGELRVLVAINQDGSLNSVKIRQSSGSDILDNAALNIVKMAAPFQALTQDIARDTDILEIIRTWQFLGTSFKDHS